MSQRIPRLSLALLALLGCSSAHANGTGSELVFTHGDGSTSAVHAAPGDALFTVGTATGATVHDALVAWLETGAHHGLSSRSVFELQERSRSSMGGLEIVQFDQTYRRIPLTGPAASVIVTLHGDDVISVSGRPVDTMPAYAALQRRITEKEAKQALLDAYTLEHPGAQKPALLGDLELVAVSTWGTIAWKGEVQQLGYEPMEIIVDAGMGKVLQQFTTVWYSLDQERPVHVMVEELGPDPVDPAATMAWNMPGSLAGYCADPDNDADCWVRMGTERLSVYDYEKDNAGIPWVHQAPITQLFAPFGPWSKFVDGPGPYGVPASFQFHAQNLYHKAVAGTDAIDPHMTAIGWDHHPSTPWTYADPASLLLMVNVSGTDAQGPFCGANATNNGGLGVYRYYGFEPAVAAAVEAPHGGATIPSISICTNDESTVFHELGHYYDDHATHGMMPSGIDRVGTCVADTSDEATALGESIADMFAAYLYAELYPALPYDMSTTTETCSLSVLSLPGSVHGEACGGPAHFDADRPTTVKDGACSTSLGYKQGAMMQAWWEFLKGKTCSVSAPYPCVTAPQSPSTGLDAMLFALKHGNGQSYKQFVHNMRTFIEHAGTTSEKARFVEAFTHHGLID